MKEIFSYVAYGKPKAWKRAGRRGNCYFDQQLKDKEILRTIFKSMHPGFEPISQPIFVSFAFFFPLLLKAKNFHDKKPDLSNLIKFYEDCFNGWIWKDDALICKYVNTYKSYDIISRTEITLYEAEK